MGFLVVGAMIAGDKNKWLGAAICGAIGFYAVKQIGRYLDKSQAGEATHEASTVLIAEPNGPLIGACLISLWEGWPLVYDLFVHPRHQGQGLAPVEVALRHQVVVVRLGDRKLHQPPSSTRWATRNRAERERGQLATVEPEHGQVVQFVAHVQGTELLGGLAHLLHNEGDRAPLAIIVADGQRDTLTLFRKTDNDELAGLGLLGHGGGPDLE